MKSARLLSCCLHSRPFIGGAAGERRLRIPSETRFQRGRVLPWRDRRSSCLAASSSVQTRPGISEEHADAEPGAYLPCCFAANFITNKKLQGSKCALILAERTHSVILDVSNMKCGGCSASVKRILLSKPGVQSAAVNLLTESAVVQLAGGNDHAIVRDATEGLTAKVCCRQLRAVHLSNS